MAKRITKGRQPSKHPLKGRNVTGGPSFLGKGTVMAGNRRGGSKATTSNGRASTPGTRRG